MHSVVTLRGCASNPQPVDTGLVCPQAQKLPPCHFLLVLTASRPRGPRVDLRPRGLPVPSGWGPTTPGHYSPASFPRLRLSRLIHSGARTGTPSLLLLRRMPQPGVPHSPRTADGHQGCPHLGAVIHDTALNVCVPAVGGLVLLSRFCVQKCTWSCSTAVFDDWPNVSQRGSIVFVVPPHKRRFHFLYILKTRYCPSF